MAYRYRQIATVKYGHFGEYLKIVKQLGEVGRARGWAAARVYTPVAGVGNEIVTEWDYPDLAAFQKEGEAFLGDGEAFPLFRSSAQHLVEGSVRSELFEDVLMDFPGSD